MTAEKDMRTFIRLHNGMPHNPKVVGLGDKAFRTYIELICYSSTNETDGIITVAAAKRLWKPAPLKELVDAGLLEHARTADGRGKAYAIHDYLKHQESSADIKERREARRAGNSDGGRRGMHVRFHVNGKKPKAECEFCVEEGLVEAKNGGVVRGDFGQSA